MEQCYGIIHTDEGDYVMAVMRYGNANTWIRAGKNRWQSSNILRRVLLFHRGVHFGVTSWWRPLEFKEPVDTMVTAEGIGSSEADTEQSRFNVVAHAADVTIHREELQANLLAVVPEDIFLATVPLYCSSEDSDSFVSVYGTEEFCFIGVTVDRKLSAVFHMVPGASEKIAGHLGRIRRYWRLYFPAVAFPRKITTIGTCEFTPDSYFETLPVRIFEKENDISLFRAMGTAMTQKEECGPRFSGATPEASFRKKRTWIYGISAGLVLFGLLAAALFAGINFWYYKKKAAFEAEYQHVIGFNKEIKSLAERNNEIAETILRLEATFSRRTLWGKFLHEIGRNRPADLYFERFGSEPIPNNTQAIKIALMGWTPKELSVTKFIATLQNMTYVTQITLSSMERDKSNRSIYGFKIICTLLLSEH
jgi:hypothetical protein